jgi:hypothetical protein
MRDHLLGTAAVVLAGALWAACSSDADGASGPAAAPSGSDAAVPPAPGADGGPAPGADAGAGAEGGAMDAAPPAPCAPSWTVTPDCGGPSSGKAPDFGPNVIVFDPTMAMGTIQSRLDGVYAQQDAAHWGTGRYAYFFKPGHYALDVKVGFYTHVVGLGQSPDDVVITGAVRAKADWLGGNNATQNFWRGAEGVSVVPTQAIDGNVDVWAVSQGTHLRRVHVKGALAFSDNGGWSSGGFLADSLIDGKTNSGTQQQFLSRNNDQSWQGSSWNMVFVGEGHPPADSWPNPAYTVVAKTPVVRERPFLYLDAAGNYLVMVPALKSNSQGHSWGSGAPPGSPLSIDRFYIAKPGVDTAQSMNVALAGGKHLLLTPGTYHLDRSLQITRPDTIVLGLGFPTLVPDGGTAALSVADVDGVTLAGLLLQAGPTSSPTLLELGAKGSAVSHAADPTALFDVHCRVGGEGAAAAQSCVTVNSADVILDNTWLWRADHGTGVGWTGNPSANGIVVNGDRVTAYGLFVEHFQAVQTQWNGNLGSVFFYQSEMPYDPPDQSSWREGPGLNGYPSYRVADGVTTHTGTGIGVYSVFNNPVVADKAIEAPASAALSHMVTVSLSQGSITHILDGRGGSVGNGTMTAFLDK